MLIAKTHYDLPTKLDPNGRPMRVFVISPTIPNYPNATFPGASATITSWRLVIDVNTQVLLYSGINPVRSPFP